MERSRGIESLRKEGMIDEHDFSDHDDIHMPIGNIITNLVNILPQNRPTASELLNSIFTDANIERTKSLEEIKSLRNKLVMQEQQIQKQHELILKQKSEIDSLKEIVNAQ